jgi:hypothetical protein
MSREQGDVKYVKQTTVVETVCVCTGANRGGARGAGMNLERFITEIRGERRVNNKQEIGNLRSAKTFLLSLCILRIFVRHSPAILLE